MEQLRLDTRRDSLGAGYTFSMPTDEEIRQFVLSSGGGPGEVEQTSRQFRIDRGEIERMQSEKPAHTELDEDFEVCAGMSKGLDSIPRQNAAVYGKMVWESRMEMEPAGFVRVMKTAEPASFVNPHLVRFLLECVWGIKRPNLLITVTGGAKDFELGNEQKDELLQGLTEAAKSVGAWFITGGTATGIMRFMGEARALYANHIPLIGIAQWGVIKGRQRLVCDQATASKVRFSAIPPAFYESACREFDSNFASALEKLEKKSHEEMSKHHGLVKMRKAVALERVKKMKREGSHSVNIDSNHSHFIFTHDDTMERFGGETAFRSQLEACISEGQDFSRQILQRLKFMRLGWEGLRFSAIEASDIEHRRIPAVCVAVQGGPGTVDTVHGAVLAKTPVLLIKGSGKAADLLADAVSQVELLRKRIRPGRQREREAKLFDLLTRCSREGGVATDAMVSALGEIRTDVGLRDLVICVLQAYEMAPFDKDVGKKAEKSRELLIKILQCATLRGCAVYDLDDPDPHATDLNGSLLMCILNSKDEDDVEVVTDKLLLTVKWDRPDILNKVLNWTALKRDVKQRALARALIEAFQMDRVHVVQMLMDHGADLSELELMEHSIRRTAHSLVFEDREKERQLRAREGKEVSVLKAWTTAASTNGASPGIEEQEQTQTLIEEAEKRKRKEVWVARLMKWNAMMKACKHHQKSQHVLYLVASARRQLQKDHRTKGGRYHNMSYREWWEVKKRVKHGLKADDAAQGANISSWTRHFSSAKTSKIHSILADDTTEATSYEEVAALLNLWRMETIYESLLGPKWRFVAGMMGPAWDIFLWSVMMNRQCIARFIWEKCQQPVLSALTACLLYRRMARLPCVKPEARAAMMRHAEEFEDIACQVQSLAMQEDMALALEALETAQGCWQSQTAFDIAVQGDCKRFVEKCCSIAMDKRWSGDISPYFQFLGLRMELWVIVSVLTGGLLAPFVLEYDLPPDSEGARAPAQRRRIPQGYPSHPFENPQLKQRFDVIAKAKREHRSMARGSLQNLKQVLEMEDKSWHIMSKLQRDPAAIHAMTLHARQELWSPTFTYRERFRRFWQAPVTLFMVRAMVYSLMVILFTMFLRNFSTRDDRKSIDLIEILVASWMGGAILKELHQIIAQGKKYWLDPWNVIDFFTIVAFWAGFAMRVYCIDGPCRGYFIWDNEVVDGLQESLIGEDSQSRPDDTSRLTLEDAEEIIEDHLKRNIKGQEISRISRQLFGVSCFFCWLRFLHLYSVDRVLGPLVLALRRMTKDIITFVFIWGVLLMAFAAALHSGNTDVDCSEQSSTIVHSQCTTYWWVLRTYFQAYGELFLNEMNDSISVFVLMLLLLVLQLVLNNTMFVAVITATFQAVWDQSQREWMIDMYNLTQEFSRTAASIPIPFNVLAILYDLCLIGYYHSAVQKQHEEEKLAGLTQSSYWTKHDRLHTARFHKRDVLPSELRKQINFKRMVDSATLAFHMHAGSTPEQQHRQARREQVDRRVQQRSLALMERARARFTIQERGKGQQTAKSDAQLRLMQEKVAMLEKDQLELKEGHTAILAALSTIEVQSRRSVQATSAQQSAAWPRETLLEEEPFVRAQGGSGSGEAGDTPPARPGPLDDGAKYLGGPPKYNPPRTDVAVHSLTSPRQGDGEPGGAVATTVDDK